MLVPKKVQHRKWQKGRGRDKALNATRMTEVSFGDFGLKAVTAAWVTSQQIEAARRAITRFVKRGGKVWIRIFPDKPITKKPPETRMGSGKGDVAEFVATVRPGRILFEMGGVTEDIASEAMRLAAQKLPLKTKFIQKD